MASEATRTIEINVEPDKLFDVITDYEKYTQFLQALGLVDVRIDSDEGSTKVVTTWVKKMGTKVSYTLRYTEDRPRSLRWTLVKGQMMSMNDGSWVLEEAGPGKTRATYSIAVRFGMLVPKTLINIMVSKELPTMLDAFKARAESLAASGD
jgi:ribosome-associated toxin RatA of RatAB toxin-antitoxin module